MVSLFCSLFYTYFFRWRPGLKSRISTAVVWISVIQINNLLLNYQSDWKREKNQPKVNKRIRCIFVLQGKKMSKITNYGSTNYGSRVINICAFVCFPYFIFRSVCFWIPVYAAPTICKLQGKMEKWWRSTFLVSSSRLDYNLIFFISRWNLLHTYHGRLSHTK